MPTGDSKRAHEEARGVGAVLPETHDEYPGPRQYREPLDPTDQLHQRLIERIRQALVDSDVETPGGLHLHWEGPDLVIEGRVSSVQQKRDVEALVRGMEGVGGVDNRLVVFR